VSVAASSTSVSRLPSRGRLILMVGGILLLGFLTTNLISFRVSTAALKATILQNELPLTSSNIYSEIQTDLLRPIFVSSLMSNDTFLKDWLIDKPGLLADPDLAQRGHRLRIGDDDGRLPHLVAQQRA
jgi:hypothetical protein